MIPPERSEAVTRALREVFGTGEFEQIERITRGHTPSLVYRIVVKGSPYLLKIITRAEDPTRHYNCMRAAAEAGVAPPVRYTNVADHISITDFMAAAPLAMTDALVRMPAVLRTLHALPPFERAPFNTTCTFLVNPAPAREAFLQKFQAANLLPRGVSEEFHARQSELAAAYPHGDADLVASHNDLFKPDNILFDGRQVWLVDWEAAFLNDRYADLAVVAHQLVTNDEEERAFLAVYFGARPNSYQRARFHLMQQLAHLFYTMAFLFQGRSEKSIDWNQPAPDFRDFNRRMWAGEVNLADKEVMTLYGRAHWERLMHNVRQTRYKEALHLVSRGRAAT